MEVRYRPPVVGTEHVALVGYLECRLHAFAPALIVYLLRALLASTREGDLVFDPFTGSGTTAVAAKELGRFFVGTELERDYAELATRRIAATRRGSVLTEIPSLRVEDGRS